MFYVYVLQSLKDGRFYTGFSEDLKRRFAEHSSGTVNATKHRLPVKLVYYEASCNQQDALHREEYLKTAWGKRYLKRRMRQYLTGRSEAATIEIARNRDAQGFPQNREADHDGIPDFSDDPASVPPRRPLLKLTQSPTNLRLMISGDMGHTNHVQRAASLASPTWQTIRSITLTNDPQTASLPLLASGPRFWRVLAE